MNIYHHQSLRLGFSTSNAFEIQRVGLKKFIKNQLNVPIRKDEFRIPDDMPKTFKEFGQKDSELRKAGDGVKEYKEYVTQNNHEMKHYILKGCFDDTRVLKEKINLFFQNQFVATIDKVIVPIWIKQYYDCLELYSLGNYKTLVKKIIQTNAMIKYLDNDKNVREKINENLARELLELFTLGEGNYAEQDIKEIARALAGLTFGETGAEYAKGRMDNTNKTIFGKTGNFTVDDVVDLIFEKKQALASWLSIKALKWFFYDDPSKELVNHYAQKLINLNFELKPFFADLLFQECKKAELGTKIKCPLTFIIESYKNLGLVPDFKFVAYFLQQQGMDVFDQPSVQGWLGGRLWLTNNTYTFRNEVIDYMTKNQEFTIKRLPRVRFFNIQDTTFNPNLNFILAKETEEIKKELVCRTLFTCTSDIKVSLNQIMPHDFDTRSEQLENVKLSLYNFIAKTPEFQIV